MANYRCFENAATFPAIIITRRQPAKKQKFLYAPIKRLDFFSLSEEVKAVGSKLDERALQGENWTLSGYKEQSIIEKMRQVGVQLDEFVSGTILYGIKTGFNDAFIINGSMRQRLISEDDQSANLIKPFVMGDDVRKYCINWPERYVILTLRGTPIEKYPVIERLLK